jgi:hypothetical protein
MEQNLIWPKPPSFTKYSYLVNRYLVPTCFVTLFMIFSGFLRVPMGDSVSRRPDGRVLELSVSARYAVGLSVSSPPFSPAH